MDQKYTVGMVGMGVMGANLARNFARNRHSTLGYERTKEKTATFNTAFASEALRATSDFSEFMRSLEAPRKIFLLVPAGEAVDSVIAILLPELEAGDMIIDGGNSHWPDTVRREKMLREKGLLFFGCGVSGGEEGALNGPSLMPGGDKKNYEAHLAPLLQSIAAKDFSGSPCVTWIGENGAGHYVKMVHNGIEYAVMQMLAEVYDMLRKIYNLPAPEIADIFAKLHQGKLESFLTEISIEILQKKDDLATGYLIDAILDKAGQKGTGKWTVLDAIERAVAIPSISEAVNARIISSQKMLRTELAATNTATLHETKIAFEQKDFTALLEDALYASMLSVYAQGYQLMMTAAQEENWSINIAEVSRIWQGGCIIRAKILEFLHDAFSRSNGKAVHLLTLPIIQQEIQSALPQLRSVVAAGLQAGIAIPAIASATCYLENMYQADGSANFIQALRDNFGAHTYERNDREGVFHANWS